MDVAHYATLIFDCDGVVLDSNKIKTIAFYNAAVSYGIRSAETLVQYHKENGGISRYKKFEYFLETIVGQKIDKESLEQLLKDYAHEVRKGLLSCDVSPGLEKLRKHTQSKWLIVSGGDQEELRDIFIQRNIVQHFDAGVFGSPDTKDTILARELGNENIKLPALFVGDSKYDHQAAMNAGIDFVFVHDWTEVGDWNDYCLNQNVSAIGNISCLMDDVQACV